MPKQSSIFSAAVAILVSVTISAPALSEETAAQTLKLEDVVTSLGTDEQKIGPDFQELVKDPHLSVALLIKELHPIERKAYFENKKTAESRHILYCLRALHYLTGNTFSAKTKFKLTDDEKQFLDFNTQMHDTNPSHTLHFFGVWMSRNADFVAPEDTQRMIIKMWKDWQKENGNTFQFKTSKKLMDAVDDWYWYG